MSHPVLIWSFFMDLGIQGKKALVCASSRGIGKAIAKTLAEEGAEVFMCARNPETLEQAVEEVQDVSQFPVRSLACDLAQSDGRQNLLETLQRHWGTVNILIHNAGGPPPSTALETTPDAWYTGFETNFLSQIALNQALVPAMKDQGWGRIVTVTSLSPLEPIAELAVSNGIRAAVTAMLKTLATEVAADGITVNCVAPGLIQTDRIASLYGAKAERQGISYDSLIDQQRAEIPAKRLGTPEEFAATVAFLCSQQAAYITGSTICVDGGKRKSVF